MMKQNKYWTWMEYKKNRIDYARKWNETNTWTKEHKMKPRYSILDWLGGWIIALFTKVPEVQEVGELDFDA